MPPLPSLGRDEQERLRNRALAKWLISGGPDEVTSELEDHGDHICAVITTFGGQAVARFRVISRRRGWQLRPEPHPAEPSTGLAGEEPAGAARPGVFERSADLRERSAALTARSAELRLDFATARLQARYWAARPATNARQ